MELSLFHPYLVITNKHPKKTVTLCNCTNNAFENKTVIKGINKIKVNSNEVNLFSFKIFRYFTLPSI